MQRLVTWATFIFIISSLLSCSRAINPTTEPAEPVTTERIILPMSESYRAELQGKTQWLELENQTITVTHDKQRKMTEELAAKLAKESQQAQQQLNELLEKNKQLQRELRKK